VLQDAVLRLSPSQLTDVREELTPHLLMLAQHPFGNYVIGTLASVPLMHQPLLAAFRGAMVRLLCNPHGSRVVQALLSALPAPDATNLISELDGHVLETALDTHGSWGVSAAFDHTRAPFILAQVSQHVVALGTQQNGCRVVQAVLKAAGSDGMDLAPAVSRIIEGGLDRLAAHCFANYVVQVLLRQCAPPQRDVIVRQLLPHVLSLSTSKHGSNVAESVLSFTPQRMLDSVCDELFGPVPAAGNSAEPAGEALRTLIEHPFGNYVLQALIRRLLDPSRRSNAIDRIRAAASPANFGRSILTRLGAE
jgi:pumilio RNA-binding family